MRNSTRYACLGAALLLFSSSAAWGSGEGQILQLFGQLDTDRDGLLAQEEVGGQHARLFTRLLRTSDTNRDNRLSADEFHHGLQPQLPAKPLTEKGSGEYPGADALLLLLSRWDADRNGSISEEEVPSQFRQVFARIEERVGGQPDGILSRNEIIRASPQLARAALRIAREQSIDVELEIALLPEKRWRALQEMAAPNRRSDPLADPKQALRLFEQLDSDGDGYVSSGEVTEQLADRFGRLMLHADQDTDGRLSQRELLALSERRQAEAAKRRPLEEIEENVQRLLQRLDRNRDQRLSRKEAPRRMSKQFDKLDVDGNGMLDRIELGKIVKFVKSK
ncbi:MAG: hypothetical protein MK171_08615 [Pirellulales bacterium]|nr:hypothetical protein [Pirellulales bacterium]